MSKTLLEVCNDWQIERAMILERNPDMRRIIGECDELIERAVSSARQIAHAVEWDTREAARLAAQVASEGLEIPTNGDDCRESGESANE